MKTAGRIVLVGIVLLSLMSLTSAQPIFSHRPTDLEGHLVNGTAVLSWERPESHDSVLDYNIYRWALPDSVPHKIGTSLVTMYTDSTIDTSKHSFYAVTAVFAKDSSESLPSNIVVLPMLFPPPHATPGVQFTSMPPRQGKVGQLYSYQPVVVTNPPGHKVCFSLGDAPDSMSIDPSTGMVIWTPDRPGMYVVEIRAQFCDSGFGRGKQDFTIMVFPGKAGTVSGTVSNTTNVGIGAVAINLFDVHNGYFCLQTMTDSLGNYSFPFVPPSTYFVRANPGHNSPYAPQWYNGVSSLKDATPVVVAESASVTVNFVLTGVTPTPQIYNVSGVVDDTNGNPVTGAKVAIYRIRGGETVDRDFDDCHDNHDLVVRTVSDSTGHYILKLRSGNYIVGAVHGGFYPQFFNHEGSPLDANIISVTGDTGNINFNLIPLPPANGILAGTLFSSADSSTLSGLLIGFRKSAPDSGFHHRPYFDRADSSGLYQFNGLSAGYYIILAIPKGDFIPTFYSVSGGTPFLDSATAVYIDGTDSVGGINIYAAPDSTGGLNTIWGSCDSGSGGSAVRSIHAVSPVAGALVTIKNLQTSQVAGSAITGQDGSYLATGFAPGSYSVTFQTPGSTSYTGTTTLSYVNNTPANVVVNAQLNASSGGGSIGLMSLQPRWNLVSVPVAVPDAHTGILFPTANSSAFAFTGSGYTVADVLDYTSGYWVRFPAAVSYTLPGDVRTSQTIPVSTGWNLIGSISSPVPTASIVSSPAGILGNDIFGYVNGYSLASTIQPGQGYWVKVSGSGTLTLSSTGSGKIPPAATNSVSRLNSITIADAGRNSQTLYFGSTAITGGALHSMPPLPPSDAFDARFTSQKLVESVPVNLSSPAFYPIALQGTVGQVVISWSVPNQDHPYSLIDASGKVIARLSGTGSVKLAGSQNSFSLKADAGTVPTVFALHQNYPNPFNPTTTLSFDLPTSSVVTMKVFNLLGQEIATLVNAQPYEAGSYNISFNASALPSGVYFYRIQAGSFENVKKMVLLK
ncbi:MAG TPA: carboxypeptidase regulatory-like domain-containing protein [Bacteroidota bacterium]|nr:carboxypeptidase regulatory-like domain-containing protein [Bacteroidota bacterium]